MLLVEREAGRQELPRSDLTAGGLPRDGRAGRHRQHQLRADTALSDLSRGRQRSWRVAAQDEDRNIGDFSPGQQFSLAKQTGVTAALTRLKLTTKLARATSGRRVTVTVRANGRAARGALVRVFARGVTPLKAKTNRYGRVTSGPRSSAAARGWCSEASASTPPRRASWRTPQHRHPVPATSPGPPGGSSGRAMPWPMKRLGSFEPTMMTTGQFLTTLTLATAATRALVVRPLVPGAAPATMRGAVVRVVLALVLLHRSEPQRSDAASRPRLRWRCCFSSARSSPC